MLLDGSTTTTGDLRGKVTLVNVWATTCVSCVKEMPMLASTYTKYRDQGYETIAVAMSYDPPAWVLNFAQTRQLPPPEPIGDVQQGEKLEATGGEGQTPRYLLDGEEG